MLLPNYRCSYRMQSVVYTIVCLLVAFPVTVVGALEPMEELGLDSLLPTTLLCFARM